MPNFEGQFLGEKFLQRKDPDLPKKIIKREKTSSKPIEKIADFMEVLEKTHLGHGDDERVLDRIKDYYYKKYVIGESDVPESYFDNQKRILREQGYGDIEITQDQKKQLVDVIQSDQRSTLDNWINYFTSPDSSSFPMWAKYWAFNGMLKISSYDKEKHTFGNRDKGTVAPFADLDREALAYVIDAIVKGVNKENIPLEQDDPEFKKLLSGANFGKLYAYAIESVTPTKENELENTSGEWIKYDQNSDHMPLVKSLQGHGTGWCTAGETTAQTQLQGGDFYVYYSYDKDNKPTIPRVAIRMQGNEIGEVRGIAQGQNLDPYIGNVVNEKLKQFPDGKLYQKKVDDMKRLTQIDKKSKSRQELDKDDLKFLYEIDSKINGFGYQKDPRIDEILQGRDIKDDVSRAIGCKREEISIWESEALSGNIKYHHGDLYECCHYLTSAEGLKLPESVGGVLYLSSLRSAEGLKLPERVRGFINLSSLTSAEGLKLPESVGGNLDLSGLTSAEGLKLPESVGGDLYLSGLTSAEGLKLPERVRGFIYLSSLTSAEKNELKEKYPKLNIV